MTCEFCGDWLSRHDPVVWKPMAMDGFYDSRYDGVGCVAGQFVSSWNFADMAYVTCGDGFIREIELGRLLMVAWRPGWKVA